MIEKDYSEKLADNCQGVKNLEWRLDILIYSFNFFLII
jgi:hypothetical protein